MRSKKILEAVLDTKPGDELVDIEKIKIDENKSLPDRMRDFLEQIKNPYLFRVGETVVEVSFSGKQSLQSKVEELILSNLGR